MNTTKDKISEIIKRTKRYWYVDGFSEIGIGILLILIILFNQAVGWIHNTSVQIFMYVIVMPLMIFLSSRGLNQAVKKLKEKITYPRTGYVSYPHKTGNQRIKRVLLSAVIGAVISAVLSIFSGMVPGIYQYIFSALVIALAYVYIGYAVGLVRFYYISIGSLALMGFLLTQDLTATSFYLSYFIGQGFIWIISGSLALWKYLRTTQPTSTETNV